MRQLAREWVPEVAMRGFARFQTDNSTAAQLRITLTRRCLEAMIIVSDEHSDSKSSDRQRSAGPGEDGWLH